MFDILPVIEIVVDITLQRKQTLRKVQVFTDSMNTSSISYQQQRDGKASARGRQVNPIDCIRFWIEWS